MPCVSTPSQNSNLKHSLLLNWVVRDEFDRGGALVWRLSFTTAECPAAAKSTSTVTACRNAVKNKENNVENILNIKYIDDLFLLYVTKHFSVFLTNFFLYYYHLYIKKIPRLSFMKVFFFKKNFLALWLYHRTNWKLTFLQVRLSLCDHVVLWWCDVFSSFCLHRCDQQVCAELIYPDFHSQSKHWRLFFFWKMKSISFWYSTWIKSFTS